MELEVAELQQELEDHHMERMADVDRAVLVVVHTLVLKYTELIINTIQRIVSNERFRSLLNLILGILSMSILRMKSIHQRL